jgi:hypothetical protein
MADPVAKVDFEFVNTFWHNEDRGIDVNRNRKLQGYGWKVYTFNGVPSITEVEELLSTI